MSQKDHFENHALKLGKIVGNLQTIEMAARLAIVKHDEYSASKVATQLPQVKEGERVEWNAFTNSNDLRQALEKYNKHAPLECKVHINSIVNLRDALAHGRTFGFGDMKHLRLLKFQRKQDNGKVVVELAQDMNDEWFDMNVEMLGKALNKLTVALDYEKREFE
ncbi:MAG: hypothetical protein L3J98_05220 [Gammaproteobacteria bacterium]|nr:hypothetical protein [Gammaproteobacteria bacterium]MCF6259551.1 hypothetical protein [Gammaproteobacteria bacterium]